MKKGLSKQLLGYVLTIGAILNCGNVNAQDKDVKEELLHRFDTIKPINSDLTKQIVKFDSTIVFKQSPNGNGLFKLTGVDQLRGSIEIIGGENKIVFAKWTFTFGDEKVNMNGLTNMAHFAFLMAGQPSVPWLMEKINFVAKDHTKAYEESKIFRDGVLTGQINYDPTTLTL